MLGIKPEIRQIREVIYARVSSSDQKGDLERQIEHLTRCCSAKGCRVVDVLSDVASGLKTDRGGLMKLSNYVVNKQRRDNIEEEAREYGVPVIYAHPKDISKLCPIHNAPIIYSNGSRMGKCSKGGGLRHRDVAACYNLLLKALQDDESYAPSPVGINLDGGLVPLSWTTAHEPITLEEGLWIR